MKRTYRRIATSYWTDPEIRRLRDPEAHTLLLYFFTSPDSNPAGLYWQPLDLAASRTRIALARVEELVARFEDEGWILYDRETEEVLVLNAIRHQIGETVRESDNRWKGILRVIADTHSDRLVAAIVENYVENSWPNDVRERAGFGSREGASKGLPSLSGGHGRGSGGPSGRRGSEAKHKHAHEHEREHQGIEDTSMRSAIEKPERFAVRITDSVLREEALSGMGAKKFRKATEIAAVNREIQELLHRGIERENLLAAMRGFVRLRERGELGLRPGKAYTPMVLVRWDAKPDDDGNPGVWYGEGDARTKRRLLDLAQDIERAEPPERGARGGSPTTIAELFAGLGDLPEAEA